MALATQLAGGPPVEGKQNLSAVLLTGTGRGCASRAAQVDALVAKLANNSAGAEAEASAALGRDLFCSDAVREQLLRNSGYYGAASGATELLQLASLCCALVLVCGSSKGGSDYATSGSSGSPRVPRRGQARPSRTWLQPRGSPTN